MSAIIEQLGLDQTFFYELGIIAVVFVTLANVYFKPFMKLFHARHQKTVADREAAEKLVAEADRKFEEYRNRLAAERAQARNEYEALLAETKKEEADILAAARDQAKKITQEAAESAQRQRDQIKKQLEADVEGIARSISETLLNKRGG